MFRPLRRLAVAGLVLAAAAFSSATAGGCAGQAARENVLAPIAAEAWTQVQEDAHLGVLARQNGVFLAAVRDTADPATLAQLGPVQEAIGPGVAASRAETISQVDRAINLLQGPAP